MTKIPTREEAGRKILAIYRQNGVRTNEMMEWEALHAHFTHEFQWRVVDFEAGLHWCIEQGFLEERPKACALTEAGYAAL